MLTQRSCIRMLLVAAVLSPGWTFNAPSADAAKRGAAASADFQCAGIGRGGHKKGLTEAQCRKQGGTVERGGAPANMPSSMPTWPAARRRAAPVDESRGRSARPENGDRFSCKGIGSGHHYAGMTKSECVKMGGTVEDAKPR